MRVCVIGAGGREHALAVVLGRTADVVVAPGNPGIPGSTPAPPEELDADLFVIGPEVPLVEGMADRLRAAGRLVFGPGADGARLEGSKAWMKQVLADAGVPTAAHGVFDRVEPAVAFLDTLGPPYVVKTDGLAAGKGVLVTDDRREAVDDVRAKLTGRAFGDAGRRVVIEEALGGQEVSLLCLCDGRRVAPLAPAQDFKRLGDGDSGPNTGGMGAYSPVPAAVLGARATQAGPDVTDEVVERAVEPTVHRLRALGIDFRGVLYAGIMLTPEGPKVLEYNVRFGDPEAQVVLPRFDGDLTGLLAEAAAGDLRTEPSFSADAAVTVVLAAEGYPASPRTGDVIDGLDDAAARPGVTVFCAGVGRGPDGRLTTAGGRVLDVTALGPDLAGARHQAYAAVGDISWPGMQYRGDIASSALEGATA
ncbi:MAG: phosphoribosylamine--glycine ligase [Actinomycetota bacterium]|nr:phosphoribosylamine--glycine ligase [Actinomycetota bacterium]